jgi:hypothetical protein
MGSFQPCLKLGKLDSRDTDQPSDLVVRKLALSNEQRRVL